jgi:hypothetical protein
MDLVPLQIADATSLDVTTAQQGCDHRCLLGLGTESEGYSHCQLIALYSLALPAFSPAVKNFKRRRRCHPNVLAWKGAVLTEDKALIRISV